MRMTRLFWRMFLWIDDFWSIKAILLDFELSSGLQTNFAKRKYIRINQCGSCYFGLNWWFLYYIASDFSLQVWRDTFGVNLYFESMWEPLVDMISRCLNLSRHQYIRTLLNSFLNGITVFFFSFLKMYVTVWKKIVRIQRRFLRDEVKGYSKISSIKWSNVCKSKHRGSLGVWGLCLVNLNIFTKWMFVRHFICLIRYIL